MTRMMLLILLAPIVGAVARAIDDPNDPIKPKPVAKAVTPTPTAPSEKPKTTARPVKAPVANGFGTCPSHFGAIHGSLINGYAFCTASDAGLVEGTPEDTVIREATDRGAKCYGLPAGLPPSLIGPAEFYSFIEGFTDGKLVQHQRNEAPFGVPNRKNLVHVQLIWQSHAHTTGGPGPRSTITQTPAELLVMYEVTEADMKITKQIDLVSQGTKVCSQITAGGDDPTIPLVHTDSWTWEIPATETPNLIYFKGLIPLLSGELLFADAILTIKNSPPNN